MTDAVLEKVEPRFERGEVPEAANDVGSDSVTHYLDGVRALFDRAVQRNEMRLLVWALTRWLAWVLFRYPAALVLADVLGWLGGHLEEYAERARAQAELAERAERGEAVN